MPLQDPRLWVETGSYAPSPFSFFPTGDEAFPQGKDLGTRIRLVPLEWQVSWDNHRLLTRKVIAVN